MHTYEYTITHIYSEWSDSWNVWLTECESGTQSEIIAVLTKVPDAIHYALIDLRNEIVKQAQS